MAQAKELFHFSVLVSFLARSKPKIPFHGLFLLRNQTEKLATHASEQQTYFRSSLFSLGKIIVTWLQTKSSGTFGADLACHVGRGQYNSTFSRRILHENRV